MTDKTRSELFALWNSLRKDAGLKPETDTISFTMDLNSVDIEFNMDWDALLAEAGSNAAHDLGGIHRHLNRDDYPAKMGDCFVPRFANGAKS